MSEGKNSWEGRSNWESPSGRKSPKWRGMSLTKLRDDVAVLAQAQAARALVDRVAQEAKQKMQVHLSEVLQHGGIDIPPNLIGLGIHRCDESPILRCIYNEAEDPSWDDCIFCHDPHERK